MLSKFWKSTTAHLPKDDATVPVEGGAVIEMPRSVALSCREIIVATTGQQLGQIAELSVPKNGDTPFQELSATSAITTYLSYYEQNFGLSDEARVWVESNIDMIDRFLANAAKWQRRGDNSPMPSGAQALSGTTAVMVFLQAGFERERETRHG